MTITDYAEWYGVDSDGGIDWDSGGPDVYDDYDYDEDTLPDCAGSYFQHVRSKAKQKSEIKKAHVRSKVKQKSEKKMVRQGKRKSSAQQPQMMLKKAKVSYGFERQSSIWFERQSSIFSLIYRTYNHVKWPSTIGRPPRKTFTEYYGLPDYHLVAVDCEMVATHNDENALARVTAVDQGGTLLDTLVRPRGRVVDYRTIITGLDASSFSSSTPSHAHVKQEFQKLLSLNPFSTVLVGHSLDKDILALGIQDLSFLTIDTSLLFSWNVPPPKNTPKLKHLASILLKLDIQTGSHDSAEDARTALSLVEYELQNGPTSPLSIHLKPVLKKLCFQFQRRGSCSYGSRCKFAHDRSTD